MTQTITPQLHTHRAGASIGAVRHETINGVAYLVAPIISAREGVMNGILYLAEELERSAAQWDGVPAPLGHPTGPDGEFVNAVLADAPGIIYHSRWNADHLALKHDAYINVAQAAQMGGDGLTLLARLNSGQIIDVSTGLFCDLEPAAGTHRGQPYNGIARNIRPDHIAILLNEPGACSVADGCGIPRVNKEAAVTEPTRDLSHAHPIPTAATEPAPRPDLARQLNEFMLNMELTLDERQEAALNAWWEDERHHGRIMDIYADRLVYRRDGRLWQMNYSIGDDGQAQFDAPVEVQYAPLAAEPQPVSNAQQPTWLDALKQFISNQFKQEADSMDRSNVIQTLLANERNVLSQETLNALSDDELAAYAAQVKPCQAQPQANSQPAPVGQHQIDELLAEFRALKAELQANSDRQKTGLIAQIVANTEVFSQAELSAKSLDEVKKLHRLTVPADYSGQGLPVANAAADEWEAWVSPIEEAH